MSNSTTSSSRNDQLKKILADIANGEISLGAGLSSMPDYIVSYISWGDNRTIEFTGLTTNADIAVTEALLPKALLRYESGELSETELSEWATFLLACEACIPAGDTEEERWEEGEGPVWDIPQRLATPSIFDELNSETIAEYVEMLKPGLRRRAASGDK